MDKIKYTVVHINDRSKDYIDQNNNILKSFSYVDDIVFFNGNTGNAWDVINHKKIKTDVWQPYDERVFPPLPGEYGIWVSTINTLEYISNNNLNYLLVLEDDILLEQTAEEDILEAMLDLPENWDFLSFYSFEGQNQHSVKTDIGSKLIHKSINQPAGAQAMLYSNSGAKKILKLLKRKGIEYTSDCFIFEQSRLGFLNGYSAIPGAKEYLQHKYKDVKSLIDPDNIRKVTM
jgi:GR25 family glycosyltransferase involved in LPS biosynthesis